MNSNLIVLICMLKLLVILNAAKIPKDLKTAAPQQSVPEIPSQPTNKPPKFADEIQSLINLHPKLAQFKETFLNWKVVPFERYCDDQEKFDKCITYVDVLLHLANLTTDTIIDIPKNATSVGHFFVEIQKNNSDPQEFCKPGKFDITDSSKFQETNQSVAVFHQQLTDSAKCKDTCTLQVFYPTNTYQVDPICSFIVWGNELLKKVSAVQTPIKGADTAGVAAVQAQSGGVLPQVDTGAVGAVQPQSGGLPQGNTGAAAAVQAQSESALPQLDTGAVAAVQQKNVAKNANSNEKLDETKNKHQENSDNKHDKVNVGPPTVNSANDAPPVGDVVEHLPPLKTLDDAKVGSKEETKPVVPAIPQSSDDTAVQENGDELTEEGDLDDDQLQKAGFIGNTDSNELLDQLPDKDNELEEAEKPKSKLPVDDDDQVVTIDKDVFIQEPDSNFFFYLMFFMFLSVVGYIAYHNKGKLLALMVEGRRASGSGGRGGNGRRKHTAAYSKLDSNLEEAITSNRNGSKTSQIIY